MIVNGLFIIFMLYECGNNLILEVSFNGFFFINWEKIENDFFLLIWYILNYSVELNIIFIYNLC